MEALLSENIYADAAKQDEDAEGQQQTLHAGATYTAASEAEIEHQMELNMVAFDKLQEPCGAFVAVDHGVVIVQCPMPQDVIKSEAWLNSSPAAIFGEIGRPYAEQAGGQVYMIRANWSNQKTPPISSHITWPKQMQSIRWEQKIVCRVLRTFMA